MAQGEEETKRRLRRFVAELVEKCEELAEDVGNYILDESNERVPVDYGFLRQSGRVEVTTTAQGKINVSVVYASPYAEAVHEAPMKLAGVPRPKGRGRYWDSGENKYLEKAIAETKDEVNEIVREGLQDILGNG